MDRRARQRGIALIAVLGFLTVMSLLVISVISASRASITASARGLARLQADAALDSGVDLAVAQLIAVQALAPAVLKQPQTLDIGGFTVSVSARPESAKIDLNFADVTLLTGLFKAAGADDDQAAHLAGAVEDWRDADDLLHLNGAEEREYAAAGLNYAPANKLFESVNELRLVFGMTDAIFACIKGDVTVLAQRAAVDIDHASPLVRRAAGITGDAAQTPPPGYSVISGAAVAPGEVYEITATATSAKLNIRRTSRTVVRVTGNVRDPYWTMAIDRGAMPGACK